MRNLILIFCFTLFSSISYTQIDSNKCFFNEFSASINRTDLMNNNTENRIGFGIGAYRSFMPEKFISIIFGFEFNRANQFKKSLYEHHFANSRDITYHFNSLSIPLNSRINFGRRIKLFIETGIYFDLYISKTRDGVMYTYEINQQNQIEYKVFNFKSDAKNISNFNYGPSIGMGLMIPLSKYKINLRVEYKSGLRTLYDYGDRIKNKYLQLKLGFRI